MKKFYFLLIILSSMFFGGDILAQTTEISAQLRPRFEFRNGYKTLMPDDNNPAAFISQRTRLNAYYANENYKFKLSLQDVRTWGDVNQLNTFDVNGTSVHEAWGEILFNKSFSFKVGRQEIIYDDHRIFGNVGWTQQARSHDAAIFKFNNKKHSVDLGFAYNAVKESLYKVDYVGMKNYKALQFIHYHGVFNKFSLSVLELYNGVAYDAKPNEQIVDEKIAWSMTIGPRLSYKGDKINANLTYYYQGGKNGANTDLAASYFAADVNFKLVKNFSFGIGGEYLSGTASKDKGISTDKSFTPLYGTNHKFNGWMDYFYVGNHGGNVGLTDIYIPLKYKYNKWMFVLMPHYFMASSQLSTLENGVLNDYSNGLGTEIDLTVKYSLSKAVQLQAGYSQMLATESMQAIKGGNYKNTNNWAWLMITFKPTFFEKK